MANDIAERSNSTDLAERSSTMAMVLDSQVIESISRVADIMASGKSTVPQHLRGNPGDCFAVCMQAMQWQMNPFAVAQKTHLVNGTLGYEAQLVNAVVQASGAIVGRFHYEYQGDGTSLKCRVGAVPRGESEVVWGEWLASSDVTTKNSPLWKVNPRQQMGYLQVKNWTRAFAPGAILGVYTADELETIPASTVDVTPRSEELPAYPQEDFEKNFETWKGIIESGKRTADDIIAKIKSRNTLTDLQETSIRACSGEQGNVYENA